MVKRCLDTEYLRFDTTPGPIHVSGAIITTQKYVFTNNNNRN